LESRGRSASAPFGRRLALAAERVRAARGFAIVVDRRQVFNGGEDITEAVRRDLEHAPELGAKPARSRAASRSTAQTQACAAVVDMDRAWRDARTAYEREHLLDEHRPDEEREREILRFLLEVERDQLRREQGYVLIAYSQLTIAVAASLQDVTAVLTRRFAARYAAAGSPQLDAPAAAKRTDAGAQSSACADLADRVCARQHPNADGCDAAQKLSSRVSAAVCEQALLPIESVARMAQPAWVAPGKREPGRDTSTCAQLVEKTCSGSGSDSAECRSIRLTSTQLSSAACSFMLNKLTSPAPPP
jgi:hypothetical protein